MWKVHARQNLRRSPCRFIPWFWRPVRNGKKFRATSGPTTGFSRANDTEVAGQYGAKRSCASTFVPLRIGSEFRKGWHTFRHTYSTLLRSVGTEFKVMQE